MKTLFHSLVWVVPGEVDGVRLLTFLLEEDPLRSKALFCPLATSGSSEKNILKLDAISSCTVQGH